jgi:hypothetical protein
MSYIVENITSKEVTTKFGPKPAYSIVANGERFSYGFKKPAFKIGDEIDFQFSENTYGKTVDMTSVQLISKGTGSPTPPPATATTASPKAYGAPAKVFPIPPLHGDRAIVRQNSITNATKAVCDYFDSNDGINSVDEYAELIIQVARKFEAYSCGDLDMQAAEEMVKGE